MRRFPEVRIAKAVLSGRLAAAATAAPFVYGASTTTPLSRTLVGAMVGVSLVVLTGWGGHISLGQFAIVGTGAVTAGNLVTKLHSDLFVTLLVSGIVGGVVALLVGLPALRIRGLFLAVTTLAFAVALDSYFLNPTYFHDHIPSPIVRPDLWQRVPLERAPAMDFLCLAFLRGFAFLARGVRPAPARRGPIA